MVPRFWEGSEQISKCLGTLRLASFTMVLGLVPLSSHVREGRTVLEETELCVRQAGMVRALAYFAPHAMVHASPDSTVELAAQARRMNRVRREMQNILPTTSVLRGVRDNSFQRATILRLRERTHSIVQELLCVTTTVQSA